MAIDKNKPTKTVSISFSEEDKQLLNSMVTVTQTEEEKKQDEATQLDMFDTPEQLDLFGDIDGIDSFGDINKRNAKKVVRSIAKSRNFRKAAKFFEDDVIKALAGLSKGKIRISPARNFDPGRLYTFVYKPKHRATLPYWDRFPIVIPLGMYSKRNVKYMTGINFHYLKPEDRLLLLKSLMQFSTAKKRISPRTKLKMIWEDVKDIGYIKKTIHTYILSSEHIVSRVMFLPFDIAPNAILLPTQQFYSKGKKFAASKVWAE